MTEPAGKLPRSVIAAFLILLALAVVVTVVRKGQDEASADGGIAAGSLSAAEPAVVPDPSAGGSPRLDAGYTGVVVGRVRGTLRQKTRLEALHPIFRGEIRSSWQTTWCLRFSVRPESGEDPDPARAVRVYQTARVLEIIAPPWPESGPPALEPGLFPVIAELAGRLRRLHPDEPGEQLAGALIQTRGFDYAGIARLTNLDPDDLSRGRAAVTAASRVLTAWEGVEAPAFGGVQEDAEPAVDAALPVPASLADHLQRLSPGLAARIMPTSDVEAGQSIAREETSLRELAPAALVGDTLGNVDLRVAMTWTRAADGGDDEDAVEASGGRYTGQGYIAVVDRSGAVRDRLPAQGAMEIRARPDGTRFLASLSLIAPLEAELLSARSSFARDEIAWGDDLILELTYREEPAP
jgi:hypothetical protein